MMRWRVGWGRVEWSEQGVGYLGGDVRDTMLEEVGARKIKIELKNKYISNQIKKQ